MPNQTSPDLVQQVTELRDKWLAEASDHSAKYHERRAWLTCANDLKPVLAALSEPKPQPSDLVQQVTGYLQHTPTCEAIICQHCRTLGLCRGLVSEHEFKAGPCLCGRDKAEALLVELDADVKVLRLGMQAAAEQRDIAFAKVRELEATLAVPQPHREIVQQLEAVAADLNSMDYVLMDGKRVGMQGAIHRAIKALAVPQPAQRDQEEP